MSKQSKILAVIFSWLAVLITMCVIARFSLQDSSDSSATSEGILKLIPFYDKLPEQWLGIIHTLIRKAAHLTIYMLLGFTAFNAFNLSIRIKSLWIGLISVGLASNYAIIDEFVFQAISPGRAPMLLDVCIDTIGAIIGSLLMLLLTVIIKLIKNKEISK